MAVGRPATKVGVSQHSCASCLRWVESLNKDIHGRSPRWIIQGTMEKMLCQPAECMDKMKDTIFSALMGMVRATKAQIRRNWKDENGYCDWEGWKYDLKTEVIEDMDAGSSSSLRDKESDD